MPKEIITNNIFRNALPGTFSVENPATVLPGRRNLRISVTPRCNLRCTHCHNEGQPPPWSNRTKLDRYESTVSDIDQLVTTATHFGVESVKLTGGDPGMYKHLEQLLSILGSDWQHRMKGIKWGMNTNGTPFLNPEKLRLLLESPLQTVTIGLDSLKDGEASKPYSNIGVPGIKLFKDLVVPLARNFEKSSKEVNINVVYTGNDERVLNVVKNAYNEGIHVRVIEVNGVKGTKYETRQAYLELLNKIAKMFSLEARYDTSLNQVYLYENTAKAPSIKFFQDHCADRDCGNCRKIHMRVVPTPQGFAAVPCFLQDQGQFISLTKDGKIDLELFRSAIPKLSIGPDWRKKH